MSRRKRLTALTVVATFAGGAMLLSAASCVSLFTHGPPAVTPEVVVHGAAVMAEAEAPRPLRVMTLNLAHGRSDGPNQLLISTDDIEANLLEVASLLRRESPDLVALQEADGPSSWSGRFSHVDRLAADAGLARAVRAENVRGLGLSYGAALIGQVDLRDPLAVTFDPSWPTFSKGFVVAAVPWPGRPQITVDVVSVHLDFALPSRRRAQLDQLAEVLAGRGRPVVVMGDLNCDWNGDEGSVREFAQRLGLQAFKPEEEIATFPSMGHRIDWILLSEHLRFREHVVLPDTVSDHRAVLAVIDLAG